MLRHVKARRLPVLALVAGTVAACTGSLPDPTDADVVAARQRWPATSRAELVDGRHLLVNRCSGCHALPVPSLHSAAEWPAIVNEMAGPAHLSPDQAVRVAHYLAIMADRSLATTAEQR